MKYAPRRGLTSLSILMLMTPGCALFVDEPPILATPNACSKLIPPSYRNGVVAADLPTSNTIGDWIVFADAQTGQLDKANDRQATTIHITETCERLQREAVEASRPRKFLGIF